MWFGVFTACELMLMNVTSKTQTQLLFPSMLSVNRLMWKKVEAAELSVESSSSLLSERILLLIAAVMWETFPARETVETE